MKISPFTPLFFIDRKADGFESEYCQVFAPTDIITLQVLSDPEESVVGFIVNEETQQRIGLQGTLWRMNNSVNVHTFEVTLAEGFYSIEIYGFGKSEPFTVTSDETILRETTLIEYTMRNNRQRTDAVFVMDQRQIVFRFRAPGGFKDSDWAFSVESDQFSDDYANTVQLFSLESTQKTFTMGLGEGVPVWYGELLNRLLVCSDVYFDGEQYVRKEGNTPEATQVQDGVNSFVFRQTLQKAVNMDIYNPTGHTYVRRIDGKEDYRTIDGDNELRVTIY